MSTDERQDGGIIATFGFCKASRSFLNYATKILKNIFNIGVIVVMKF